MYICHVKDYKDGLKCIFKCFMKTYLEDMNYVSDNIIHTIIGPLFRPLVHCLIPLKMPSLDSNKQLCLLTKGAFSCVYFMSY